MTAESLERIITLLNDANVRYMVVGGLAVNAHGYVRLTVDVDLLIQLEATNVITALAALGTEGFQPTIPVTAQQFADPATRQSWITDKGMKVLKLYSDRHRETPIDVFVSDPLGFTEAASRVVPYALTKTLNVPVCGYQDLITLKLQASRPKDLADLDQLRKIRGEA